MAEHSRREVLAIWYAEQAGSRSRWFHRYQVYGEPGGNQSLDYFFWAITEDSSITVVDTGISPEAAAQRGIAVRADPREDLRRVGLDPDAVTTVVLTHYHYDHIGSIGLFPDAEIVLDEAEHRFWTGEGRRRTLFSASTDIRALDEIVRANDDHRVRLMGVEGTVSAGIRTTRVPGHTPGQSIVTVDTDAGAVVLASDAAHLYEELERDRPFAIFNDLMGVYTGYDRLRALAGLDDHIVVPGHDPEVMRRFEPLSGDARD
ncbi:MAG: N-acyl homoserine lactonase family protein [Nocardioides sp.]|nr:N-acyl homoserine lactonase family protein [Nocardioides sp.]